MMTHNEWPVRAGIHRATKKDSPKFSMPANKQNELTSLRTLVSAETGCELMTKPTSRRLTILVMIAPTAGILFDDWKGKVAFMIM